MAQTFDFKDPIPFPAEKVLEKVTDLDFIKQWTLVQQGQNPHTHSEERTDERLFYKLDLDEPLPKPFGTMKAHMTFEWDLKAKKMTWERRGEGMGDKARISGSTEILPDGDDACFYVEHITIDIPIPMIGKKAERQVAKYLKESRPEKIAFLIGQLKG